MTKQSDRPVDYAIVSRNQKPMYRTAIAVLKSKTEAEDAVQDAFVKYFEKRPAFSSPEHEKAWFLRVTINICKSRFRSFWWQKTDPLLESHPAQDESQETVLEAVMQLTPKYRTAIHLYYYEGYNTKEIAELTSQTEPAVRQQLSRARGLLKTLLQEDV